MKHYRAVSQFIFAFLFIASIGAPGPRPAAPQDAFFPQASTGDNIALAWNTFLGGIAYDEATGIALDNAGNIYVVGSSSGTWGARVCFRWGNCCGRHAGRGSGPSNH